MTLQNSWNNELNSPKMTLGSDQAFDIYYRGSDGILKRLPPGNPGDLLIFRNTGPTWENTAPSLSGNAGGALQGTYPNPGLAEKVVSYDKFQDIPTSSLLGRAIAGTGSPIALTSAQVISLLGLTTAATTPTGNNANQIPVVGTGGTLDPAIIPRQALNNPETVSDAPARLAITSASGINLVKQLDTGVTYGLRQGGNPALEASWIALGDTAITASDVTSGLFDASRLGTSPGSAKFLRGDRQWVDLPPSFTWETATTSRTMVANRGYIVGGSSRVDLSLPTTATAGDRFRIAGANTAGWRLTQNSGQRTYYLSAATSLGDVGRIDSNNASATPPLNSPRSSIELVCITNNTEFQVVSAVGVVDVV